MISPPLRFLVGVVGAWAMIRAALLAPEWPEQRQAAAPSPAIAPADRIAPSPAAVAMMPAQPQVERPRHVPVAERAAWTAPAPAVRTAPQPPAQPPARFAAASAAAPLGMPEPDAVLPPRVSPSVPLPRWSGSAWALLRRGGGGDPLAPGGMLGGSQAGVRLSWRIAGGASRPLALSLRLSGSPAPARSAEAALGIDWRPIARVPVNILAERRQRLAAGGRSDFAVLLHGGLSEVPMPGGTRLDLYGQAGIVGIRSRDAFADGAARIALPIGDARIGAGAWAGAQPGLARLDVGPHASIRLPVEGADLRLSADWRFRIAGDAAPASGPALTLATDF